MISVISMIFLSGIKQGQPGKKQGQPWVKQGQGHMWSNAKTFASMQWNLDFNKNLGGVVDGKK